MVTAATQSVVVHRDAVIGSEEVKRIVSLAELFRPFDDGLPYERSIEPARRWSRPDATNRNSLQRSDLTRRNDIDLILQVGRTASSVAVNATTDGNPLKVGVIVTSAWTSSHPIHSGGRVLRAQLIHAAALASAVSHDLTGGNP